MVNTFSQKVFALFALIGFAFLFSFVVAHAQDRQGDDGDTAPVFQQEDSISQQDHQEYSAKNFEAKFGVHFHAHRDVCAVGPAGDAHCNARVTTDGHGTPSATPKVIAGYGPSQFLKAYSLSGIATGTRPVIAIVDAYDDPYIVNDLTTYSTQFGIPQLPTCTGAITASVAPCFKKVNQRGSTSGLPRANSGWALEISLDVETAHALCQNCSILLVEANSATYGDLMTAVDQAVLQGAKVVSNSYGSNEFSSETFYDNHFNHPGVAFIFSSGDSGYGAEYPASSQYVTAVGGTSLFLNADSSYNTESAWSGAGSGCSAFESKPLWQMDAGCAHRTVADVSADADPNTGAAIYDSFSYAGQRGWFQVGGTSLAAPIIASVYALSGNTSGAANSLPYANTSALHDVHTGSNGSCGTYLCTAVTGFDGPTGLGSPNGIWAF